MFAGQRDEGFYVDLGSIFDLADLRPFQNLHLIPTPAVPGVNATKMPQRAHDRDPGPEDTPDARRLEPDQRWRFSIGDRRLGSGLAA